MQRLKGLDGVRRGERIVNVERLAKYENGQLKCMVADAKVGCLFTSENFFAPNKDLEGGCMQLGWNTVGIFEEYGAGLHLIELAAYKGDASNAGELERVIFTQVTTRAVDSCTFAHVKVGRYHILAHLDVRYLERGKHLIENFIASRNLPAFAFCSHIYAREENRFSNELRQIVRQNYSEIIRHDNSVDFRALNDGDQKLLMKELYAVNRYGHMEIGLSCERNGIVLFGDITNNSNNHIQTQVPTRLFANWEQLSNIYNNEMLNLRRR